MGVVEILNNLEKSLMDIGLKNIYLRKVVNLILLYMKHYVIQEVPGVIFDVIQPGCYIR